MVCSVLAGRFMEFRLLNLMGVALQLNESLDYQVMLWQSAPAELC